MKVASDVVDPETWSALDPDDHPALPEWVSVAEASFLAEVPLSIVETWSASGAVGSTRLLLGRGPAIVLVRTEDVLRAPHPMREATVRTGSARPARKHRLARRIADRLFQVLAVVLVLLEAHALVRPATVSELPAPTPPPGIPPILAVPIAPAPGITSAPDHTSAGTSRSAAGVARVQTGSVRYVQQGSSVSAMVTLTNPNAGWWLPGTELSFTALDGRGRVVATYQTAVTLGPSESKIAVAPALTLGSSKSDVRSVEVVLPTPDWQRASTFAPTGLAVLAVQMGSNDAGVTFLTGQVANDGIRTVDVRVSCAVTAGGRMSGIGVLVVRELSPGTAATFSLPVQLLNAQPDAVTCTADPAG